MERETTYAEGSWSGRLLPIPPEVVHWDWVPKHMEREGGHGEESWSWRLPPILAEVVQ